MGVSESEKSANDMTRTGQFCPNDNHEMERVSGESTYTCHMCGRVDIRIIKNGKVIQTKVEFAGT